MTVSAAMKRAWRRTSFNVGHATAKIGRRSRDIDIMLDRLGVQQAVFVTGWNPNGTRAPQGLNDRMTTSLCERVRDKPYLMGLGEGPRWAEQHLLIPGDPRRAIRLGRTFRQLAVVVVRRGQPAALQVLQGDRHATA